MKIALLQDQLLTCAGSERVFLHMTNEFKEADIFTLCYNKDSTWPEFKEKKINTHPLGKFIKNHKQFKLAFPISTYLMQCWNFNDYDLIISSSATTAKYISNFKGIHISYCYFPTRAIWNYDAYFEKTGIKEFIFSLMMNYFKKRDIEAASRVHYFFSISEMTKEYVKKIYRRDSEVLFSPVETDKVDANNINDDFYLIVSRLEKWKKIEYAIEAFNFNKKKLVIIGTGPHEKYLKSISNENIFFKGFINTFSLASYLQSAKAVIHTPYLEYGLVPIEAAVYGTPSICYGKGGVVETMNDKQKINGEILTSVFFRDQNSKSLNNAIDEFEKVSFNKDEIQKYAEKFSVNRFQNSMRNSVNKFIEKSSEK